MSIIPKFDFSCAMAGVKPVAIAATLAATVIGPSNALSQASIGTGKTAVPTDETLEKTKQRGSSNILEEYYPFLEFAASTRQSCCGQQDAQVILDEDDIEHTGDPLYPIRIRIRQTQSGLTLEKPVWIKFHADKLLTSERAGEICDVYNDLAEANDNDLICDPPPFTIAFMRDGTTYNPKTGMHTVNHQKYPSGTVITPEQYGTKNNAGNMSVYCAWIPEQNF